MRQYAGFASAEETNERFRLLLERGQTGPLGRVRPADAARPRLRRPAGARRGRAHRRRDRLARRHAAALRRHPARRRLDVDDDQRAGGGAPAALRARGRRARRRARRPARHGAERRAQGVRRARQLHLPAAPVDAPHRRPLPLLQRAPAALQHDLDLRVPHPRGRLERRAGARLHARQRHRVRRGGARRRPRVDVFAPRLSFFFNAHNDVFAEVAKFRAARRIWATVMRERFGARDERSLALRFHAQTGRLDADRAGAADERRARRAAGLRRDRRRLPVAAHERLRRGARAADRALGDARAAHPAGAAARVGRRRRARSVRRLGVRRGPDRRDRARGARADRRDRRARRRGRGDRERLDQGPHRGRGLRAAARDRERRDRDRRRQPLPRPAGLRHRAAGRHAGQRAGADRAPAGRARRARRAACERALAAVGAAARDSSQPLLEPLRAALAARCTVGEVCGALRDEWGSYDAQVSDGR